MALNDFAGLNVATARRKLAALLRDQNFETPDLDARLLAGAALHLDLTGLAAQAARALAPSEADALAVSAARRLAGEPVARILGVKEFWGLPLRLSPATLVPRPDTETVVEAALAHLRNSAGDTAGAHMRRPLRIADIGTGSGAILLALLHELPQAQGIATDISPEALVTARGNADALGLASRLAVVCCDFAAALRGPFDLIVSNPPYIRSTDIPTLPREVRNHDPRGALDGGADGLAAYRILARESRPLLAAGGALILEVGHDQAEAVSALLRDAGWQTDQPPRRDLSGIARVVAAMPHAVNRTKST
jgi:release factor glutamine methyltransferase